MAKVLASRFRRTAALRRAGPDSGMVSQHRSLVISLEILALLCGGTLLGVVVRLSLPASDLSEASQGVVKLGMGVLTTMTALVLGLLVASAKGIYDSKRSQINQIIGQVTLLERLLIDYGTETLAARYALRQAIGPMVACIWQAGTDRSATPAPFVPSLETEELFRQIRILVPQTDAQHFLQDRALMTGTALAQVGLLLFAELSTSLPKPLFVVLVFWLFVIFLSFGLPAPPNLTILAVVFICALSASGAIYLILDMSNPFDGLIMIPSEPLRNALPPLDGVGNSTHAFPFSP